MRAGDQLHGIVLGKARGVGGGGVGVGELVVGDDYIGVGARPHHVGAYQHLLTRIGYGVACAPSGKAFENMSRAACGNHGAVVARLKSYARGVVVIHQKPVVAGGKYHFACLSPREVKSPMILHSVDIECIGYTFGIGIRRQRPVVDNRNVDLLA